MRASISNKNSWKGGRDCEKREPTTVELVMQMMVERMHCCFVMRSVQHQQEASGCGGALRLLVVVLILL